MWKESLLWFVLTADVFLYHEALTLDLQLAKLHYPPMYITVLQIKPFDCAGEALITETRQKQSLLFLQRKLRQKQRPARSHAEE